ncbi:MAG TPA: glycerate kinase [Chthoniobacterales bacterium]|jgi:glycerate 2-kinase|nr:glycerate kinase [Chthoniobacterales bacterium]
MLRTGSKIYWLSPIRIYLMRYLIAPDKFKGTLSASEVCQILAQAVHAHDHGAQIDLAPIADGGEGTAELVASQLGAERRSIATVDALERSISAEFFVHQNEGFIDMSSASGLWRIPPSDRRPLDSNTFGTGLIVRHLWDLGIKRISIGLGGSATVDAGFGLAAAVGYSFLDKQGNSVRPVPTRFATIEQVIPPDMNGLPDVIGLADVETRLLGPEGAIHVFGPQKGLQSDEIESLDRELTRLVDRVEASLGSNHSETICSGAAGGFGYGILTFLRGKLVSGFAEVAQRLQLLTRISAADVVITGEGKLDRQSLQGKGPFGVAEIARRVKKPIWVIAGTIEDTERIQEHFDKAISVVDQSITLEAALKDPAGALRQRAAAFWQ